MKNFIVSVFLIAAALFLLRQEWEPHPLSAFNWEFGKTIFNKVYVIGTDHDTVLFTIPTGESKWMTPEEAKEYNNANEPETQKAGSGY